MNETLLRDFRGENEDGGSPEGTSVARLEQLLSKVNLEFQDPATGVSAIEELSEEEKKEFDAFVLKEASQAIEVWEPWWKYRTHLATQ